MMGPFTRCVIAVIVLASVAHGAWIRQDASNGKDCFKQNKNVIDKLTNSCPGVLDPPANEYCCLNINGEDYCCDAETFALETGLGIVVPVVIAVIVVISLIGVLVSCLCCKRCPWYRNRHSG